MEPKEELNKKTSEKEVPENKKEKNKLSSQICSDYLKDIKNVFGTQEDITKTPSKSKDTKSIVAWNLQGFNNKIPQQALEDIATFLANFDIICLVEVPKKNSIQAVARLMGLMNSKGVFYESFLQGQYVCIVSRKLLKEKVKPAMKLILNHAAYFKLSFKSGNDLELVVVHLKSNSNATKGGVSTSLETRQKQLETVTHIQYSNSIILGDFNWSVDINKIQEDKVDSKKIKGETKIKEPVDPKKIKAEIERQYRIPTDWKLFICENTMVDPKKNKVNDGFLVPTKGLWKSKNVVESGVITPGPAQEDVLPIRDDPLESPEFAVIKISHLRRLRMSTYTDHFPVYIQITNSGVISKEK